VTTKFRGDLKLFHENINAMTRAMDKVVNDKDMSDERKEQMIDAIRRLYLGEPTELEVELLQRMISAAWGSKDN
jgi:tRNA C32,U32 (ribose-2'-O)-methylase TrmJ